MANALQDNLRVILSRAVEEAASSAVNSARSASPSRKKGASIPRSVARSVLPARKKSSSAPLAGVGGVLAGAGAAALAPVAVKGATKLAKAAAMKKLAGVASAPVKSLSDIASAPVKAAGKVGSGVSEGVGSRLSQKLDKSGGPSGVLKDAAKKASPFSGRDDDGKKEKERDAASGIGDRRRMPIQQSVDIGLPVETVYNQWTQFEEWPNFMQKVTEASQEDDTTVSFKAKIWGKNKEFKAVIESQQPDERIKWHSSEGTEHEGVVTFHELGPNLTRVMVSLDVDPGPLEKFARGARHIDQELHRFKAFIEMEGQETGGWRGVIEDGEVVEQHDRSDDESESAPKQKRSTGDSARKRSSGQRSTRSRASSSGANRSSSSANKRRPSARKGSSSRSQGSSNRSQRSSGGQGASRSQSSASRGQRSSSAGRRSGSTQARGSSRSSSRNGSKSSGRSGAARGGSNSSGRSGSSSGRSRSATRSRSTARSRTQASRSNGSG
jgi:uncharacterized membrane protein